MDVNLGKFIDEEEIRNHYQSFFEKHDIAFLDISEFPDLIAHEYIEVKYVGEYEINDEDYYVDAAFCDFQELGLFAPMYSFYICYLKEDIPNDTADEYFDARKIYRVEALDPDDFPTWMDLEGDFVDKSEQKESISKTAEQKIIDTLIDDPSEISTFSKEELTYSIFLEAVSKNGRLLFYAPPEYVTAEVCKAAYDNNAVVFNRIPEKYLTQEWCDKAVGSNYYHFRFIPDQFKTLEMCKAAYNNNADNIEFIPEKYLTQEWCEDAIESNCNNFRFVPEQYKTLEMCKSVVPQNGYLLSYVPIHYVNLDLVKIAVRNAPGMLGSLTDISYEYMTKEVVLEALSSSNRTNSVLNAIPKDLLDHDIYLKAVEFYPFDFRTIPKDKRDYDICLAAIKRNPNLLQYVPEENLTEELCCIALNGPREREQFKLIPKNRLTSEICKMYVKTGSAHNSNIEKIPLELLTEEICITALHADPFSINKLPSQFLNERLKTEAMKSHYAFQQELMDSGKSTPPEYLEVLYEKNAIKMLDDPDLLNAIQLVCPEKPDNWYWENYYDFLRYASDVIAL